jgi:hypothetical protein
MRSSNVDAEVVGHCDFRRHADDVGFQRITDVAVVHAAELLLLAVAENGGHGDLLRQLFRDMLILIRSLPVAMV